MIDGTTHSEHCWSFGPKHYECALARIAQLEADLKVAQNYEDQHYERCQQLEAALKDVVMKGEAFFIAMVPYIAEHQEVAQPFRIAVGTALKSSSETKADAGASLAPWKRQTMCPHGVHPLNQCDKCNE